SRVMYPLPLHDALPILPCGLVPAGRGGASLVAAPSGTTSERGISTMAVVPPYAEERREIRMFCRLASWPATKRPSWSLPERSNRSEEHTSELQSPDHLV